jgi:hypothetical protein
LGSRWLFPIATAALTALCFFELRSAAIPLAVVLLVLPLWQVKELLLERKPNAARVRVYFDDIYIAPTERDKTE